MTMANKEELFQCSMCGELTPMVMKKDRLHGGVQHNYAECQACKGKVTHSYTDKHIRGMLAKQRKLPPGLKKERLAEKIHIEMEQLKLRYDRLKREDIHEPRKPGIKNVN